MFNVRLPEENPIGIDIAIKYATKESYEGRPLEGSWWRVWPSSSKEVSALRLLDHRVDKFAPLNGNGAIVSHAAILKFAANSMAK
jgi:hypothetical protein